MTHHKTSWLELAAIAIVFGCGLPLACEESPQAPPPIVAVDGLGPEPPSGNRDGAGPVRDGAAPVRGGRGPIRDGAGPVRDGAGPLIASDGAGPVRDGAGPVRDGAGPIVASDGAGPVPPRCPMTDAGDDAGLPFEDSDAGAARIRCESALGQNDEKITCEKSEGNSTWTCHCPSSACAKSCRTQHAQACGADNCCGVTVPTCRRQSVSAEPPSACADRVASGAMTACGYLIETASGIAAQGSCCPPDKPFSCPNGSGGTCFATPEQASAACNDDCVECVPAPRADAIGLGQLCDAAGPRLCPTGSDCVLRPTPQGTPASVGFCSPLCNAFAATAQCPYASAPAGIRTECSGPSGDYLNNRCVIINDGCSATCPTGFNCQTGGCFPD